MTKSQRNQTGGVQEATVAAADRRHWKKAFETLNGDEIKIRFVEHQDYCWFIVYATGLRDSTGFVKNVPMSEII